MPIAILIVTALAASVLTAVTGFGGAVIMLPVLVWTVGFENAIPVLTIAQLIGNLSRVVFNRHELNWHVIWRFSLGAVPTAIIGGIIFATAPAAALVRVLGVFLIVMVVYRHTGWGKHQKMSLRGFVPLGASSGMLSAVLGTVGPFAAPFFLSFGVIKGAYIGTEAMTAVIMHVTKLGVYGGYALISLNTLYIGLGIGVIMILGTFLGKRLLNRVPERIFPYIIEATMLVAGLFFIIRG